MIYFLSLNKCITELRRDLFTQNDRTKSNEIQLDKNQRYKIEQLGAMVERLVGDMNNLKNQFYKWGEELKN